MNAMHRVLAAVVLVCGGWLGPASFSSAIAQEFPSRPVRLFVPFPPGGTLDLVGRLLADRLRTVWTQPVIVENRVGANTALAVEQVIKSPPDGHTLLIHAFLVVTVPHLQKVPYDVNRELVGVAQTAITAYALAASAQSGFTTWDEVVAAAHKQPGKFNYGSGGNGSAQHLFIEMIANAAKASLTHVPYKGNGPALQALLAGDVALLFDPTNTVISLVKSGKARALMVTGDKPNEGLPGVPAMGVLHPQLAIDGWHGVFAPAATPKPILDQLSAAVRAAVLSPALTARFREMGFEASGLESGPFTEVMRRDYERWGRVIRENNIRSD